MTIPAFVSYSHRDKKLAGLIKEKLDFCGFETFLAHDDLKPSVEWQKTIVRRLKDCQVFLPLLTDSFPKSSWTDQETGMAVALGKIVVPMKVTINPYGFISKIQAQSFADAVDGKSIDESAISRACWKIVKTLAENMKVGSAVKDGMITAFGRSRTFAEAAENAKQIEALEPFTQSQMNEIVRHAGSNSQIYSSWKASNYVKDLIRRKKKDIDQSLAQRFARLSS
jgi:hypothetical protein